MSNDLVPRPRPPIARASSPPTASVAPPFTLLDVLARPVDLEPGLWVWSVYDGDRTCTAHGHGDGTQVAKWIRERWAGPIMLRGTGADKICAGIPDAVADTFAVPLHEQDTLAHEEESRAVSSLPRLQVATDGAAANGCVGSGWVASDGRHGAVGGQRRGSRQANAARAEFRAVAAAVSKLHPDRRVELLIDATTVVADVRRAVAGQPVQFGSKMPGQTVAALDGRDVQVTWVAGHSGHPMNEAADRLAVYARRCAEASVTCCPEVMAGIVAEACVTPEVVTARSA